MVTVAELMKVLQKVKNPSETGIFVVEIDEEGDSIKRQGSETSFVGGWLMQKDICDCNDNELCCCVTDDYFCIEYRE